MTGPAAELTQNWPLTLCLLVWALLGEKKIQQKNLENNNLYSLHSVHGGENQLTAVPRGSFFCLLVILVPGIFFFLAGPGLFFLFYFRTSPHVQALVTNVSIFLSANIRIFQNSNHVRIKEKSHTKKPVRTAKLKVSWASLPSFATNRKNISIERQLAVSWLKIMHNFCKITSICTDLTELAHEIQKKRLLVLHDKNLQS